MSARSSRVVAELGRPETPEETEARVAEGRRLRRQRQNARNLVYSLLACVVLVVVIVLAVPRGAPIQRPDVDYRSLASQSQGSVGRPLLAPATPSGWKSNVAELRTADGVTSWYVGFVLPGNRFLSYTEGIDANSTWLADQLDSAPAGGTATVGGLPWRVYDQRSLGDAAGNVAYALATRIGTTDLVVAGTASPSDVRALAASLAAQAASKGLTGTETAP
ncbi:MAG TPA: DUF4245 domain-containing protein [Amnibacterium sp.]|nr:DUF4245 domain-containing protein [Amnibacterium sp.]